MPRISKVASAAGNTIALTVAAERGVSEIIGLFMYKITTGGTTGDSRITVKSGADEIWESVDLEGISDGKIETLFPFVSKKMGDDLVIGFKTSGDRTLTAGDLLVTVNL